MSLELRARINDELNTLVLIDPHTHINPLEPASKTLADILGYHYYTELAHSAGMAKSQIEEPRLPPKEKVARLMVNLGPIDNTIQYSWFIEMAQALLGFEGISVGPDNWEPLYDLAVEKMSAPDWADQVLKKSNLEAVFLTNDFDDPLSGFDTDRYIPCLRTDDLVFNLAKVDVVERLERATGTSVTDAASLRDAIACLFTHFKANGARACAISLPPDFAPTQISAGRAQTAVDSLLRRGLGAAESDRRAAANFVFWTLAEFCGEFKMPFDLMIGVNRGVYEGGVHQGRDLYDSRVSLIQYKALFNAFPKVVFPISVLTSVTNQELTSYSWIFPNVVTNGHWWYSNTPTFIEHDLACRLEAVPRTKQIGYYSDMYKLEFALPKFNMYKRILSKVLAERYVVDRGWSESRAIDFGKQILRGNVESLFGFGGEPWTPNVDKAPARSVSIVPKPAWSAPTDFSQGQAGLAASGASGGTLGLAAMGVGVATAGAAAALSAFQPVEAPPVSNDDLGLADLGDDFAEEQPIAAEAPPLSFEPAYDLAEAPPLPEEDLDLADFGDDSAEEQPVATEEAPISFESDDEVEEEAADNGDELTFLAEQPFVADSPLEHAQPFIAEAPSDTADEFSLESEEPSEEIPTFAGIGGATEVASDENVAAGEPEVAAAEEEGSPEMESLEPAIEFSLDPEETEESDEEAPMFTDLDTAEDAETDVNEEAESPTMASTEPDLDFSLEPGAQETEEEAPMFTDLEDAEKAEPEAEEEVTPLAIEPLEPRVEFSQAPAETAETDKPDDDAAMFAAIEAAVDSEELDELDLEELDMEDIEVADEAPAAEPPANEFNFNFIDKKDDKKKK